MCYMFIYFNQTLKIQKKFFNLKFKFKFKSTLK